ncbi:THO complex subunit 1 transcription elongation factor-domain-containing protein [Aspergillus welwitschiae]|uniref:THO complex subunit 1 transcription elongation factor-domain-containing protein n=1 Tax=Aspergillus welwitschiae TaxID=1341132 RepID=A0A3F3PMU6_9EURO|nr:THO complex subunit 1 transcription elongation factor-domain-containing protein [Aspergillus welwitschiae]RDH27676.1 THO complex subunit 1 transcription elongation factor-domain-containing protein [Aspergillus welwitschiae]
MADVDVGAIHAYRRLIDDLLNRAERAKPDNHIEPPLTESQLGDSIWLIQGDDEQLAKGLSQQTQFAAVEIAFREKFYSLLASTSIEDPSFIRIWNLLDIISIFSDNEQCEPGLIFWLSEELLDSQTIDGCRKVFDYLESRRERNTKKHFKQKSLIILRSCNELLRRLSRAEDTVFCGRVFIFLFQSFPLGDKSAVNLRGEYHTDNVTTYDELTKAAAKDVADADVEMSDEQEAPTATEGLKEDSEAQTTSASESHTPAQEPPKTPRVVVPSSKDESQDKGVDLDDLYPMFWGLQAYFSAPTKTFDPQHFAKFKTGLEATLSAFKNVDTDLENSSNSKMSEEIRKSTKRKRTTDGQEIASSFNPKYLTSRDLFDLEVNDTAFRRHVLVQALILLDFMLSLTPKAKAKLADLTNKSVLYGFVLHDDDAKWAVKMRKAIEEYLQEGIGGKFYYRMVDTVLSRDKNWVRWKAEGCPLIERPPVSVSEYLGAREHATKVYANKRLRTSPMGSLDLKFLSEGESLAGLERLKDPERFSVPAADSLMMGIMDDELDIDTAQTKEDREYAMRSKSSKTWRILRLSAKSKLAEFEKIEDGKNLKILFETPQQSDGTPQALEGTPQASEKPPAGSESTGHGQEHGAASTENENSAIATEQASANSVEAAAPEQPNDVKNAT